MMSVVQVFFHDKMAAVAHLVYPDQLPKQTQVQQTKNPNPYAIPSGSRQVKLLLRTSCVLIYFCLIKTAFN